MLYIIFFFRLLTWFIITDLITLFYMVIIIKCCALQLKILFIRLSFVSGLNSQSQIYHKLKI